MAKVFLGGAVNDSRWRDYIIKRLEIDYINPVVEELDKPQYEELIQKKAECNFFLYVVTPKMTVPFSIAELIDDSNKFPEKTIFCYLELDGETTFSKHQVKSLVATGKMVEKNGGKWFKNFNETLDFLNAQ